VLQIKYLIAFRFRLIYAVKPHTEKVTMVSLQTEANLIVTASQDCTLFFFRFATTDRGIDMDPIRCITLEHVAINFEWISLQVLHFYEKRRHPFYAIFPFPYFSNVFLIASQRYEALLIFETDEVLSVTFPVDFFEIDPTLVTFRDKYPDVKKHCLSREGFKVDRLYHAEMLGKLFVAFVKANEQVYLVQCMFEPTTNMAESIVPPAIDVTGGQGEVTAVRFW